MCFVRQECSSIPKGVQMGFKIKARGYPVTFETSESGEGQVKIVITCEKPMFYIVLQGGRERECGWNGANHEIVVPLDPGESANIIGIVWTKGVPNCEVGKLEESLQLIAENHPEAWKDAFEVVVYDDEA